jgi:hypothetical protein
MLEVVQFPASCRCVLISQNVFFVFSGVVIDVVPEEEKIVISLLSRALPRELSHVKMVKYL